MDLAHSVNPHFTKWVVANDLLNEPFVLVDVGCLGGISGRWSYLGKYLRAYAFDPLPDVITELRERDRDCSGITYFHMALGNEDRSGTIIRPPNPTETSIYRSASEGIAVPVEFRKLDTLYANGEISPCDFIKLDCEGHEPFVLKGARHYLDASTPLGVEAETSFWNSATLPNSHFSGIYEELLPYWLFVADLSFDRIPLPPLAQIWPEDPIVTGHGNAVGRPGTFNFLFARPPDWNPQAPVLRQASRTGALSFEKLIKLCIIYELYGLNDVAANLLHVHRAVLQARLDIDTAISLLARDHRDLIAAIANGADELRALGAVSRRTGGGPFLLSDWSYRVSHLDSEAVAAIRNLSVPNTTDTQN